MNPIIKFNEEDSPKEILSILEANCDLETDMSYIEPLSPDQKQAEDLLLSDKTQEIYDKEDEIKEVLTPLKEDLKYLKTEQLEIRKVLKEGGHRMNGRVFVFLMDDNRAQLYSENGTLLEVRPLTRSERQLKLKIT